METRDGVGDLGGKDDGFGVGVLAVSVSKCTLEAVCGGEKERQDTICMQVTDTQTDMQQDREISSHILDRNL